MQQQNVFFLDTCFWLISAIIIYLIYPMIYCIMWAIIIVRHIIVIQGGPAGWPTLKEQKIMKEKNMKYVITKSPAEINKDIDKLKDTSEWKSETRRFIKKAMKMISSWFNVKHS